MNWTLQTLVGEMAKYDPTLTLSFETPAGAAGPGFHVTEFKRSHVSSIDCGGNLNAWDEVGLQLLDGYADDPMSLEKFARIAAKSASAVSGLAESPIYVEFAPKNAGLSRYAIGGAKVQGDKLVVQLVADSAVCKPAERASLDCCGSEFAATTSYCGTAAANNSSCC